MGKTGMGGDRRARRQARAREFGARHPRLTLAICILLLAGMTALCGYQLSFGAYLGPAWVIAASAGAAAAAGLSAAVFIRRQRNRLAPPRLITAWVVLALASVSAIRFPFPAGPYGSVQAFFNVVHATLLGSEAVTCMTIIALCAYGFWRVHARGTAVAGRSPERATLPARLRFPGGERPAWRAGHLVAANGSVTWRSLNGHAEVDLTAACQALPLLPDGSRGRQPRTTALATAGGLAEVDVSPKALTVLAGGLQQRRR